jgi:energy-coupling factor transport system ATP-binding protein
VRFLSNTFIDFNEVTFRFPDEEMPIFTGVSFSIEAKERVVLFGPSGCGKSTLLYLMNRLYPSNCDGILEGTVTLFNQDATSYKPGDINQRIATVFQDPESQFCMPTVEQEMAFTLENLNISRLEMESRITKTLSTVGLIHLRKATIQNLSGGIKQRVATACALLMEPEVLLLDEPLAHLDPLTAQHYVQWLNELQVSQEMTIIVVEHRLDLWGSFFDRAIHVTDSGVFSTEVQPVRSPIMFPIRTSSIEEKIVFEASQISVSIKDKTLLREVSLHLRRGEIAVLAGPNGSGKSTFLKTICRIFPTSEGRIDCEGNLPGYVPQSPEHLFVTQRVSEEIKFSNHASKEIILDVMERLRLHEVENAHPFSISHGQKRRVAIGAMLADQRPVLLLDEPTSGQDAAALLELFHLLDAQAKSGVSILIVTHDMTFAKAIADTIFLMKDGELTGRFDNHQLWDQTNLLNEHQLLAPYGEYVYV